jgi:hypothetical protein
LPLKPPNASRHVIDQIPYRPYKVTDINTIIEPWVDVEADVAAINRGAATYANERYTINGRVYGVHAGRRLFPVSGAGFIQLSRTAYRILGVYNQFGDTPEAARIIGYMRNVPPHDLHDAQRARRMGGRNR